MAATGVFRGIVVRNDSSGVWVHTRHANGDDMGDMPQPCLVTPGTIVTVGAPVIVGFEQNVRNYPVILGNYGPTYVPPGTLLKSVSYNPANAVVYNATGTAAAVDDTHLTIPFLVPSSGQMIAKAAIWGLVECGTTIGDASYLYLGYVSHGQSSVISPVQLFLDVECTLSGTAVAMGHVCNYEVLTTGWTPGETLQWDLAFYYAGNTPTQAVVSAGGTSGQALLSIYAA